MDIFRERCAGSDAHKKTVVRVRIARPGGEVESQTRAFGTMTADLLELADWLKERGVRHAAMESTGVYWEPIWHVLGASFELILVNAARIRQAPGRGTFPFDRPGHDRPELPSSAEVMAAVPQVRIIIDAKERRINRPEGFEAQKPSYSGKKKAHTPKTRVVVDPTGRIETASDSVPGGANHDLPPLRGSGVLERPGEGEGAMLDRGYVGVKALHPGVPVVIPFKASRGHPLTEEQVESNREVARYRIVVGHSMARLNRFTVLRRVFRGQKREA